MKIVFFGAGIMGIETHQLEYHSIGRKCRDSIQQRLMMQELAEHFHEYTWSLYGCK